jgi:predicted DNA-binding protein
MNRHHEQLVSVVFRLPREKLERLRKLASTTRIRQSEFLREAIGSLLKKHEAVLLSCAAVQLAWEYSQLTCGCGRSYTWAQYLALPAPPRGSFQDVPGEDENDPPVRLELRNCSCLSTMARNPGEFPEGWEP